MSKGSMLKLIEANGRGQPGLAAALPGQLHSRSGCLLLWTTQQPNSTGTLVIVVVDGERFHLSCLFLTAYRDDHIHHSGPENKQGKSRGIRDGDWKATRNEPDSAEVGLLEAAA
jgi:hypothetical protein